MLISLIYKTKRIKFHHSTRKVKICWGMECLNTRITQHNLLYYKKHIFVFKILIILFYKFQGCMRQFTNHIRDNLIILAAVGVGMSVIPIFGFFFSCVLYVKIKHVIDWPRPKPAPPNKCKVFDKSASAGDLTKVVNRHPQRTPKIAKRHHSKRSVKRPPCPLHSNREKEEKLPISTISDNVSI